MYKFLFLNVVTLLLFFCSTSYAQKAPSDCENLVLDVSALLFHDSKVRDEAFYELFSLQGASVSAVNILTDGGLLVIDGAESVRRSAVRNLERLGYVFERLSPEELASIPRMPHKLMRAPAIASPEENQTVAVVEPHAFRSTETSKLIQRKLVWIRDHNQTIETQVHMLVEQFDFEVLSYQLGLRQLEGSQIEVLQIFIKMAPEAAGVIPRAAGFVSLTPK